MNLLKKPVAIITIIVLLVGSITYIGYKTMNGDANKKTLDSLFVEVEEARQGALTRELTLVGNLEADHSVVIKPQVRGLISKVYVRGGEEVNKGELLFEIDDRSYQAALKEAQAQFKLAQSIFNRAKELKERNFAAAKSYDEAEARLMQSEAAVEKAQKELDDTKIRAPFSGVVGIHKISEGTPAAGDLELITLTDVDPIKVLFKVPARYIPFLSIGQNVNIEIDSYPDQKFSGRISAIDTLVDQSAQSVSVVAEISNKKRLLKPGLFVRVDLTVGSANNALIVPEEAVIASGDQSYVWRIFEHPEVKGKYFALRVPVSLGIQDAGRVQITRGRLAAGDLVVVVGQGKLTQDGIPVRFDHPYAEDEQKNVQVKQPAPAAEKETQDNGTQSKADNAQSQTPTSPEAESMTQENSPQTEIKKGDEASARSGGFFDKIIGFFSSSSPKKQGADEVGKTTTDHASADTSDVEKSQDKNASMTSQNQSEASQDEASQSEASQDEASQDQNEKTSDAQNQNLNADKASA